MCPHVLSFPLKPPNKDVSVVLVAFLCHKSARVLFRACLQLGCLCSCLSRILCVPLLPSKQRCRLLCFPSHNKHTRCCFLGTPFTKSKQANMCFVPWLPCINPHVAVASLKWITLVFKQSKANNSRCSFAHAYQKYSDRL